MDKLLRIKTPSRWADGRPVFLVPAEHKTPTDRGSGYSMIRPRGSGKGAYQAEYNDLRTHALVIAGGELAEIYQRRRYARQIGIMRYSAGIERSDYWARLRALANKLADESQAEAGQP